MKCHSPLVPGDVGKNKVTPHQSVINVTQITLEQLQPVDGVRKTKQALDQTLPVCLFYFYFLQIESF